MEGRVAVWRWWWWWGVVVMCCAVLLLQCSPLIEAQETTTDRNDCYQKPCLNGGTCVDLLQSYRCDCPRNFNGTNCEEDLARLRGCLVSPCENGATCQNVTTGVEQGALPYRCSCPEGFTGVNCETLLNQCEKTPPPCVHGTCTSDVNAYTCNCSGTGFSGTNCSEDIDECVEGSPCGAGTCFNRPGSYSCSCPLGADGHLCQDINECVSSPCQNGAACSNDVNNYTCICVEGFRGRNCQENIDDCVGQPCSGLHVECVDLILTYRCQCQAGYKNESGVCQDINECDPNPCRNEAPCTDNINAYNCSCLPGYSGLNCQIDLDECASQPCRNNATCVDGVNSYSCSCATGYASHDCESNIDDCLNHRCLNGATCNDQIAAYNCSCVEGWTGQYCADNIDDCASQPCHNNATCNDQVAAYTCSCLPGYTDAQCQTNIDDCDPDPCQSGAACTDGVADYSCACPADRMGKDCSAPYDACSFLPCQNEANCSTTVPQREYTCSCVSGFTGQNCETNIDDCVGNDCLGYQECYDGVNNYTCACPVGKEGVNCGDTIDECAGSPCQNGGTCAQPGLGYYNCTCPQGNAYKQLLTGWTGVNCEVDINECDYTEEKICANGGNCVNKNGSYQCFCIGQTADFKLITGANCEVVSEYCSVTGGNPCKNGGTCSNVNSDYHCDCVPGFTDKNCTTNIDECVSSPCQNNGTCTDGINGYNCSCIPGITGRNCEINIDDCQGDPCGPGTCMDRINYYECDCFDTGFKGDNCSIDIVDCLPDVCLRNGTCIDGVKSYTCECNTAYTGLNCEIDIQECNSSPCFFNGNCLEYSNRSLYGVGRANFTDFSYANAAGYECECVLGTEGVNCQVNIDDCVAGACQNNATCQDLINDFTCLCAPGYTGDRCETEINECLEYTPCQNGADCTDLVADYTCRCLDYARGRRSYGGKNCSVYLSGCDQGNECKNNGDCIPVLLSESPTIVHGDTCRCQPGFSGRHCEDSTTMTFSSNGSRVTFTTPTSSASMTTTPVLSFRFRTTLTSAVLAVYSLSPDTLVSVEISASEMMVVFVDGSGTVRQALETQEHVNNGEWHHAFLDLGINVSLTLVSDACGAERCVKQFSYPRPKPSVSEVQVQFGNVVPILSKTFTGAMFVGCLEDVKLGETTLFPGQLEGMYINSTAQCPRSLQCLPHTCSRHGDCVDLWDHFRCDCQRPYWGDTCQNEYTAATFSKDGVPSLASFDVSSLAPSADLDLSLFLRTRQEDSASVMYLTNGATSPALLTFLTLELQGGRLASRLRLCQLQKFFNSSEGGGRPLEKGSLNFVHFTLKGGDLRLSVNNTVHINQSVEIQDSCPFSSREVYFGKVPESSAASAESSSSNGRRRRATDEADDPTSSSLSDLQAGGKGTRHRRQATASSLGDLEAFDGVIQDVQLQGYNLDFQQRAAGQGENFLLMSPTTSSNVTLGAESTLSVCNSSQPCQNGGSCSDVFFNDFKCDCPDGYLGKNCSQPDFCKPESCVAMPGARCQSLQIGFECIVAASFGEQRDRGSYANYTASLPSGLPAQTISFMMRTRAYFGIILEVHTPSGAARKNFIKVRLRDGSLEVNYLLKADGFSSSLRLHERRFNDGRWYKVEVAIALEGASSVVMRLQVRHNGTIVMEDDRVLSDTVTDLAGLVSLNDSSILVGEGQDLKEQFFTGCLEEVRLGGVLLPFLKDYQMAGNTAQHKFTLGSYRFGHLCVTPNVCPERINYQGCWNGGTCRDVWKEWVCDCPDGYAGRYCTRRIGMCSLSTSSCLNDGVCLETPDAYRCGCSRGYSGRSCQTPQDVCAGNACDNNSTCTANASLVTGYVCDCSNSDGFTGEFCNVSKENKSCADGLCENKGTCVDNASLSSFSCDCSNVVGFSGSLCDSLIDRCANQPCNNGTCNSNAANFTCDCHPGFTGDRCETDIDECINTTCPNGGTCVDGIGNYSCQCTQGWTGLTCESDVNECDSNVCQHGECQNRPPGDYTCDCLNSGYVGKNCSQEFNECEHNFCVTQNTVVDGCSNLEGDYTCNCTLGYEGKNCSRPTCDAGQCLGGSTCQVEGDRWRCQCLEFYGGEQCNIAGPCVNSPCNATHTSQCVQDEDVFNTTDPASGNTTCQCNTGWNGDTCSEDVDECLSSPCQNEATCVNFPGGSSCSCTLGYTGAQCQTDIDECLSTPCQNGGTCQHYVGFYNCSCSGTGYDGDDCETDIDECSVTPAACNNGTCTNTNGSFTCDCLGAYLGPTCQHLNPCASAPCINGGACNHTGGEGAYVKTCSCVNGYSGDTCEQSPQTDDAGINPAVIIGPVVGVILLIVIIAVIVFLVMAREKRATRGAYSPSRQETAGARVELGNVLKKPPEERLI